MILVLLALVVGVLAGLLPALVLLRAERDRVNDLLRLLESKAAPAEFAAYVAPAAPPAEEAGSWVFSDDGLIGTWMGE